MGANAVEEMGHALPTVALPIAAVDKDEARGAGLAREKVDLVALAGAVGLVHAALGGRATEG